MNILIDIVENLYYALYSRIQIELASVELCAFFPFRYDTGMIERIFRLPEPNRLGRILLALKDVLDSPNICPILRKGFVAHFQETHVNHFVKKYSVKDFRLQDPVGYRKFAVRIARNRKGEYHMKWRELIPCFNTIPAESLVMMSERYLQMSPVAMLPDDVPYDKLPFMSREHLQPDIAKNEKMKDYHLWGLAKMEGTSIGDERQKDPQSRIYYLVKQHKCICTALCLCSEHCTKKLQHPCPCAERHMRIMSTKRGLSRRQAGPTVSRTAGTLARMYFQGLVFLKPEVEAEDYAQELKNAFEFVEMMIIADRGDYPKKDYKPDPPLEYPVPDFF
jgi:hypothetical protein